MKTRIPPVLITFGFVCFGLFPKAQGVLPPPDGGYPGFNTAEGQNALFSLTTGTVNTAVGWFSLFSNTDGSFNTAVGAGTLLFNVGDQSTGEGTQNTAFGAAALLFNVTGAGNTATGMAALLNNTEGNGNTAVGAKALVNNTSGDFNMAIGGLALSTNTTGNFNTAVGGNTLLNNTAGNLNAALGLGALNSNTTGGSNTALGASAGNAVTTASNVICIGHPGENVDNTCYIGQIFGATSSGGTAVFINGNGKLGTTTSSKRFKDEIKPMDKASEALFSLKPVSFRYKNEIDPAGTSQLGLVAEDVQKVNRDLVVRDKEGKPYSVRYDQVNAMLLNEFLKEHRKVEEQEAAISRLNATVARQEATGAEQQKEIQALTEGLQKVSAQLEASKPAPQVVKNP
jgi:trimeric autotransporter adhesin